MDQLIKVAFPVAVTTAVVGGVTAAITSNNVGAIIAGASIGGAGAGLVTKQRNRHLTPAQENSLLARMQEEFKGVSGPLNQRLDVVSETLHTLQSNQGEQGPSAALLLIKQDLQKSLSPLSETLETINVRLGRLERDAKKHPDDLLETHEKFQASIMLLRGDINSRIDHLTSLMIGKEEVPLEIFPKNEQEANVYNQQEINVSDQQIIHAPNEQEANVQDLEEPAFPLLKQWLKTHGIEVLTSRPENEGRDEVLDKIALSIGKKTKDLRNIRGAIKYAVGTRKTAQVNLKTQSEILHSTSLCNRLNKYGLIRNYNYNKSSNTIYFEAQSRGDFDYFLTGGWFERSVFQMLDEWLKNENLEADWLINPKLRFPNGDVFELDLLFMIDEQPLWLECKAGRNYNDKLVTYSEHRKQLKIPKSHALMVILDCPEKETSELTHLWDLTIVNEDNFMEVINNLFS